MNAGGLITLLAVVVLAGQNTQLPARPPAAARPPKYRLRWTDLPPLMTGHTVSTTLADGARVSGIVLAVEPDALALDVRKSSDRAAWPKGRALVPRALLTGVRLTRETGYTWRFVGTAIGGAIGALIGIPIAVCVSRSGTGSAVGAALIAVPPTFGYLAGRSSDRKVMDLELAPRDRPTP